MHYAIGEENYICCYYNVLSTYENIGMATRNACLCHLDPKLCHNSRSEMGAGCHLEFQGPGKENYNCYYSIVLSTYENIGIATENSCLCSLDPKLCQNSSLKMAAGRHLEFR